MISDLDSRRSAEQLREFVIRHCLPLWRTAGFDDKAGCFHERLQFSGAPVAGVNHRLLVQARQIVVYSRAYLMGWDFNGKQIALRAFQNLRDHYHSPDGRPGWIFSMKPSCEVADLTRDLYSHAFVIYMLAWVYRLVEDQQVIDLADQTLLEVDQIFKREGISGYAGRVPDSSYTREQNPHMHLLEGLLALADVTGSERYIARAGTLVTLFHEHLLRSSTGALLEHFDDAWQPALPNGRNLVEPGHQMEWVWLLREWQRLSGINVDGSVASLLAHAMTHGLNKRTGMVRSLVTEDGDVVSNESRVWPLTETIRALFREGGSGAYEKLISKTTKQLFELHLRPELKGGWIDRTDARKRVLVDHMPASTLYHLAGSTMDIISMIGDHRST